MVTTFYPPFNFGGDGIYIRRLSNELARRGHHVEVIHCTDAYRLLAGHGPNGTYQDHSNVTVHGLKSRVGFLSPLATQQTGFPLFKSGRIRRILSDGFDVIHYHNISLVGGPGILKLGQGIKLYTMHEYWLVCPTHVLLPSGRVSCKRPHCLACTLMHWRPPQLWRYVGLLERMARHVDVFIAPSRFARRAHLERGLHVPIVHLPYFVPDEDTLTGLSISRNCSHGSRAQQPYFLFVGRLEKLKGLQDLIPVLHAYDKASLVVAGSGSYEWQLRHLAGDGPNIQFLGHVSQTELRDLYHRATALIVPSICPEVFGIVIIEAFRHGTPVIVRNRGAMPQIVQESGGGLIYDTNADLVTAMDTLVGDPVYRAELGHRGYQAYLHKWTPAAHLSRYFDLIDGIVA